MFTGIVEQLGTVTLLAPEATGVRLRIQSAMVLEDLRIGASIAVNGCCLTVVDRGEGWWAADVVPETLRRTCLGTVQIGDRVNLERPLALNGRLDGHMVLGHVDDVGEIEGRERIDDGSVLLRVRASQHVLRYIAEKGSIAVDGVSLTVVGVDQDGFSVALIPHTQAVTTLGLKNGGERVNLEVDVIARYLERLVQPGLLAVGEVRQALDVVGT